MPDFYDYVKQLASKEGVSEQKVFISEVQKIFIEEFFKSRYSRGFVLIGGCGLRFGYREDRYTKDIDFGCIGDSWGYVNTALGFFDLFESILQGRIGFSVSCKVDSSKTVGKIFVNCPPLGGIVSLEVDFSHFIVLEAPEKVKVGTAVVLCASLKEIKVDKIIALLNRPKVAPRDIYDLFVIDEPVDYRLLERKLKRLNLSLKDLENKVKELEDSIGSINQELINMLDEDLGVEKGNKLVSDKNDFSLINRVIRELKGI